MYNVRLNIESASDDPFFYLFMHTDPLPPLEKLSISEKTSGIVMIKIASGIYKIHVLDKTLFWI